MLIVYASYTILYSITTANDLIVGLHEVVTEPCQHQLQSPFPTIIIISSSVKHTTSIIHLPDRIKEILKHPKSKHKKGYARQEIHLDFWGASETKRITQIEVMYTSTLFSLERVPCGDVHAGTFVRRASHKHETR